MNQSTTLILCWDTIDNDGVPLTIYYMASMNNETGKAHHKDGIAWDRDGAIVLDRNERTDS